MRYRSIAFDKPKDGLVGNPCPTIATLRRRLATTVAAAPALGPGTTRRGAQDDEAKVRTCLRLLVEAPVRASDRLDPAEAAFIEVAAGWSEHFGVDRRTLTRLGVPRDVLDAVGVVATPVAELIRRRYGKIPFIAADLVRKSGVSMATVRSVLAEDEQAGRSRRVKS